jgi:hypothetical protein
MASRLARRYPRRRDGPVRRVVALTAALDAAAIDYALRGAVALAIHGAPRATKDIDLLAREADLPRLRDVVRSRGFTIEALPLTFSSSGISIRRFTRIEPDGRTLMVDVLFADAALESVWQTRVRIAFATGAGETTLWSVSKADLISLKLTAGRPQDIVDIQRLEEVSRGEHGT